MSGKNILVFGKYYPPFSGGIEAYTKDVCENLARTFHVTILCFTKQRFFSVKKENSLSINFFPELCVFKSQPISLRILLDALLTKTDLIHLHAPNFILLFCLLLRHVFDKKIRFIITHHTDVYGRKSFKFFLIPFYKLACRHADAVIVYSKKIINISEDLPKECNFKIIPLSVNCQLFPLEKKASFNNSLLTVGFLGRHARYKGIDVLLRAVHQIPDTFVRIAGDGPYRNQNEILAKELGLCSRASFLGDISSFDQKVLFFNSIDIFVFPSTEVTETFGIVQLEAMMMGIPVISSDLPTGVTDIAIHEKTALLIRPGNVKDLVETILRLSKNRSLRARLAAQARKHVISNFDKRIVMKKTLKVFHDVLSQK